MMSIMISAEMQEVIISFHAKSNRYTYYVSYPN